MYTVIDVVNRANQRGGRMLSLVDLLIAGTVEIEQAAWLLARLERGSSFLVGATPGGAGKTTIMAALLGTLPEVPAVHLTTGDGRWKRAAAGECVVAYEINAGPYEAYIWGDEVAAFTRLGAQGCRIVSNLHADTPDQAREQIVGRCGAEERAFRSFELFLPITVERHRGRLPRLEEVWLAGKAGWHPTRPRVAPGSREEQIAGFLEECRRNGIRRIEQLRNIWLAWRSSAA